MPWSTYRRRVELCLLKGLSENKPGSTSGTTEAAAGGSSTAQGPLPHGILSPAFPGCLFLSNKAEMTKIKQQNQLTIFNEVTSFLKDLINSSSEV